MNYTTSKQGITLHLDVPFSELSQRTRDWLVSKEPICELCNTQVNKNGCFCDLPTLYIDFVWRNEFFLVSRYESKLRRSRNSSVARRTRLKRAEGVYHASDIQRLLLMQESKCYYCDVALYDAKGGFQIDHILPLSRDGTHWPENLALTCKDCNKKKWNFTERQFWLRIQKVHGREFVLRKKVEMKAYKKEKLRLSKYRKIIFDFEKDQKK